MTKGLGSIPVIGSLFGGGVTTPPPAPTPAPPAPMPTMNDAAIQKAQTQQQALIEQSSGRASTILDNTTNDKLGG